MKHPTVPYMAPGAMSRSQTAVSDQCARLKAEQPEVQPCFMHSCMQTSCGSTETTPACPWCVYSALSLRQGSALFPVALIA